MKTGITKITFIATLSLLSLWVSAQNISLKTQTSGIGREAILAQDEDAAGNIFYSGNYQDSTIVEGITLAPSGITPPSYSDAFVAKNSVGGGSNWAISIGGPALLFSQVSGLSVDGNGDVIFSVSTVILADSIRIGDFMSVGANGAQGTGILVKVDAQGNFIWGKAFNNYPGAGIVNALQIVTDAANNFYLSGFYSGALRLGNDTISPSRGQTANFIAKGDANGSFLWAKNIETQGVEGQFLKLDINDQSDVFISGTWNGDTLFVDNQFVVNPAAGGTNTDRYFTKINSSGNVQWIKREGGIGAEGTGSIKAHKNGGLTICSYIAAGESLDIDEGSITVQGPVFLFSNYNDQGALVWNKTISVDVPINNFQFTGDASNYYLTAEYDSPQLNLGSTLFSNIGGNNSTRDVAIVILDSAAKMLQTATIGSPDNEVISNLTFSPIHGLLISGSTNSSGLILGTDTMNNAGLLTLEAFIAVFSHSIGFKPVSKIKKLGIYPNPTQGNIHFSLPDLGTETYEMVIYNSIGKIIVSKEITALDGDYSFNLEFLESGAYFMRLSSKSDIYAGTFIKD